MLVGAAAGGALTPLLLIGAGRLARHHTTAPPVPGPVRVILVAALAAVGGAAVARLEPITILVAFGLFAILATVAAAVDLAELRLPDLLTYPLLGLGGLLLLLSAVTQVAGDPIRALAAAVVYGGWMLVVALLVPEGYGLGDVKLAAALGLWLGLLSWLALATAVLFGQLFIVVSLLTARIKRRRSAGSGTGYAPLGPALVGGALLALLLV